VQETVQPEIKDPRVAGDRTATEGTRPTEEESGFTEEVSHRSGSRPQAQGLVLDLT